MVICLERGADLWHMAQLMPLPLTVSCFSKIRIGFTFLVPAHPGSPGQRAVVRVRITGREVWRLRRVQNERASIDRAWRGGQSSYVGRFPACHHKSTTHYVLPAAERTPPATSLHLASSSFGKSPTEISLRGGLARFYASAIAQHLRRAFCASLHS